jgi:hypothetical protein
MLTSSHVREDAMAEQARVAPRETSTVRGLLTELLTGLTTIAKRNNGALPTRQACEVIDGYSTVENLK